MELDGSSTDAAIQVPLVGFRVSSREININHQSFFEKRVRRRGVGVGNRAGVDRRGRRRDDHLDRTESSGDVFSDKQCFAIGDSSAPGVMLGIAVVKAANSIAERADGILPTTREQGKLLW